MASSLPSTCAACGVPATTVCAGCKNAPESVVTVYCTKDCQTKHWKDHKWSCKKLQLRKQLYRTALFVQQLWYIYRSRTYDYNISRVTTNDGILTLHGGPHHSDRLPNRIYRLPSSLEPGSDEWKSVLCAHMCQDAVVDTQVLITKYIKGLCNYLREVYFTPKNPMVLEHVRYDGTPLQNRGQYSHCVFQVALANGERYAIDISGAQYGIYTPFATWERYEAQYIKETTHIYNIGHTAMFLANPISIFGYRAIGNAMIIILERSLIRVETIRSSTIEELLKAADIKWNAELPVFLDHIDALLHGYLKRARRIAEVSRNAPVRKEIFLQAGEKILATKWVEVEKWS